jgi:hypothetical protein
MDPILLILALILGVVFYSAFVFLDRVIREKIKNEN